MKTRTRIGLACLVLGLALVASALHTPSANTQITQTYPVPGGFPPPTFFFAPETISVTISSLNVTQAQLVILPLQGNLNPSPEALVNVTVVAKDIVTFDVPTRGYYEIDFVQNSGASLNVSFIVDEGGIPKDLLYSGIVISVIGTGLTLYFRRKETRESRRHTPLP
jgi:hypothetical protein